jgi:1-deoxy-D-xylulose-5-phosphate synthase
LQEAFKKFCCCKTHENCSNELHKDPWEDLVDTAPFFEQYGLNYIGPVDGHSIEKLLDVFEDVKQKKGPHIIHLLTNKGHGMEQALQNPTCYHGVKPFEKVTGTFLPQQTKPSFPKIFGDHMVFLAAKHSNLVALTPAMPVGSCLTKMMEQFPDRCLDVGIAEGHCVTFAGGLALDRTKKVVVSVYATFLQRALDNLFQDVCLQKAPVIFALDRSGLAGGDGATHNGIYDIGFLKGMPNLLIAQPRDGTLLQELLTSAMDYEQPIAIRYPNLPTEAPSSTQKTREIGKGEVVLQGRDILILACGHHIKTALDVAKILEKEGVFPTVIDPIFIKPLDEDLLKTHITSHQIVITLEEHALCSGFGEIINSFILRQSLKPLKVLNLGIPDLFVEHGSHQELLKELKLDAISISETIISCFSLETLG